MDKGEGGNAWDVNVWMQKNYGYAKMFLALGYDAKMFHGYPMQHRCSMRVDVGVPYTGLMVDMKMIISYIVSEIETNRNSLRTKIIWCGFRGTLHWLRYWDR